MVINKSHLQKKIENLEDMSFDPKLQKRYTNFFNKCADIFDPDTKREYNGKSRAFYLRFGMSITRAERLIYDARVLNHGKTIVQDVVDHSHGYPITRLMGVNWYEMEQELDYLVHWCFKKVNFVSWKSELDFSKQIEIKQGM